MKLRYAARSPFVRKVLVVAHEHGLAGGIELVPTTLSPVQGNELLAEENPLMKVPSLVTDDGQVLFDRRAMRFRTPPALEI
jgi:glutathione S-transferase